MKKKIIIFTAARSDFGIMKNTIIRLEKSKKFDFTLIVGAAHYSNIFGKTIHEIKKTNIKKLKKINFMYSSNSKIKNILKNLSNTMIGANNILKNINPDCAIIMGDRYEMMAFAISCLNNNIPIAHVCGGSKTLGSIDNEYRNSISLMSKYHFVETKFHKKGLNNLGIRNNIFIVGAPALENYKKKGQNFFLKIQKKFFPNFDFKKKTIISCFHPETNKNLKTNYNNLSILITFLNSQKDKNIIFTYPNADYGYKEFISLLKKKLNKKIFLVPNLGVDNYYSILEVSNLLIGNSSSGIIESTLFNLPTINLGDRQKYRYASKNVHNCVFDDKKISKLSKKLLSQRKKNYKNEYYKKNTSKKIVKILESVLLKK